MISLDQYLDGWENTALNFPSCVMEVNLGLVDLDLWTEWRDGLEWLFENRKYYQIKARRRGRKKEFDFRMKLVDIQMKPWLNEIQNNWSIEL